MRAVRVTNDDVSHCGLAWKDKAYRLIVNATLLVTELILENQLTQYYLS